MKRIYFLVAFAFISITSFAQTYFGYRLIAKDSIMVNGKWVYGFSYSLNSTDSSDDKKLPTAKAVVDWVRTHTGISASSDSIFAIFPLKGTGKGTGKDTIILDQSFLDSIRNAIYTLKTLSSGIGTTWNYSNKSFDIGGNFSSDILLLSPSGKAFSVASGANGLIAANGTNLSVIGNTGQVINLLSDSSNANASSITVTPRKIKLWPFPTATVHPGYVWTLVDSTDGSGYWALNSSLYRPLDTYTDYSGTANTGATPSTLYSYNVPGNTLNKLGQRLVMKFSLRFQAGGGSVNIKLVAPEGYWLNTTTTEQGDGTLEVWINYTDDNTVMVTTKLIIGTKIIATKIYEDVDEIWSNPNLIQLVITAPNTDDVEGMAASVDFIQAPW